MIYIVPGFKTGLDTCKASTLTPTISPTPLIYMCLYLFIIGLRTTLDSSHRLLLARCLITELWCFENHKWI